MSLVGNFTINSDRTAQYGGIGTGHGTLHQQDRFDESGADQYPLQERPPVLGRPSSDATTSGEEGHRVSPIDQERANNARVTELARQLTRQSSRHQEAQSLSRVGSRQTGAEVNSESGDFLIEKGTELDPFSDNFNVKAWTRRIVGVTSRDPELHPKRTAGVAFRNLQVHGFGSDTGFQQTVGNAPYAGLGSIRELVGGKKRKVDILKGFDAVLDAGDMLVVLGPPGRCVCVTLRSLLHYRLLTSSAVASRHSRSGCSTLLKTIAGETHGLEIEEGSYINYQGESSSVVRLLQPPIAELRVVAVLPNTQALAPRR
jgi:ATP-binding cassette subfamily G (WHITE) protein 2 (PDR)